MAAGHWNKDVTCRMCLWWRCDIPEQDKFGFCHRYPPTTTGVTGDRGGITAWPNTSEVDWCGEFVERAEPLPERTSCSGLRLGTGEG